jgi:hypothetical protein
MKFRSPTAEPIYVGLTTGHTCQIPPATDENPDGIEIEARFRRAAIAEGAIPAGVPVLEAETSHVPTRTSVIDAALNAMADGNEASDFKRDGTPDMNAVTRRCGFKVSREEVDSAWAKIKAAT